MACIRSSFCTDSEQSSSVLKRRAPSLQWPSWKHAETEVALHAGTGNVFILRPPTRRKQCQLSEADIAVIVMGFGDLIRAAEVTDFFRWEIDSAREAERTKGFQVVAVMHGISRIEELVAGRKQVLKDKWISGTLEYLRKRYTTYFDTDKFDWLVDQIQVTES